MKKTLVTLSRFHQLNFLVFGSPVIFPGIFWLVIFIRKLVETYGILHRAFHYAPINTCCIPYLALVRPILEHASITWHPLNKSLTNRREACQRFACRVVLQSWNDSHEDLLFKSDLPVLVILEGSCSLSSAVAVFAPSRFV